MYSMKYEISLTLISWDGKRIYEQDELQFVNTKDLWSTHLQLTQIFRIKCQGKSIKNKNKKKIIIIEHEEKRKPRKIMWQ